MEKIMVSANIVVNSHLSDLSFETRNSIDSVDPEKRIEFIKRLISRMNGDLNNEVTDEELHFQWETLDEDAYEARLKFEKEFGYYFPKDKN